MKPWYTYFTNFWFGLIAIVFFILGGIGATGAAQDKSAHAEAAAYDRGRCDALKMCLVMQQETIEHIKRDEAVLLTALKQLEKEIPVKVTGPVPPHRVEGNDN